MSKLGALADDSLSIMDGIKIYSNPVSKKKVIDSNKIKNNSNAWAGVQLNPVSKHDDNL